MRAGVMKWNVTRVDDEVVLTMNEATAARVADRLAPLDPFDPDHDPLGDLAADVETARCETAR